MRFCVIITMLGIALSAIPSNKGLCKNYTGTMFV